MMHERPDPQKILLRLKDEQKEQGRGRLKVFFGFSAGVGKTYSMLEAARKLAREGLDVVIGYVETHGRKETAELTDGLETLPRKQIDYRGVLLEEFDVDAALARKPALILVDELAHSNVAGSRHAKRWQDIEELLASGIDVCTCLNVQHIESLHDVVAQITGIRVHERVPDSTMDGALELELVDLPPDELLLRLAEGKVYLGSRVESARDNFFRKGNLIALRELALRYTAQHVDKQMMRYRAVHEISQSWPVAEHLLVCVSGSPLAVRLVRAARRMADAMKARWTVVYVQSGSDSASMQALQETLRLAENLGADVVELGGGNIAQLVTEYASESNVSKIIVGKTRASRWVELVRGSVVDDIVRRSGDIDVYVMSGDDIPHAAPTVSFKRRTEPSGYFKGFAVFLIATGVAALMLTYFETSNLMMIYIMAVVVTALNFGRGPSVMVSFLSVAVFDFFFVPPYLTFVVSDTQYLVSFCVMLTIALVLSALSARVREQAVSARERERRTGALYALSKDLAASVDVTELTTKALTRVGQLFDCRTAAQIVGSGLLRAQGASALETFDHGVADWCLKNGQKAGLGTATLPGTPALYLPLTGSSGTIGVMAVLPAQPDTFALPQKLHLLETFANQIAVACERAMLSAENEKTTLQVKSEQLRSSLLSSVSHDLRTPLATIAGAASSIVEASDDFELSTCKTLASEIYGQSVRLNRLVTNLLDMTRLESGEIRLNIEYVPVDEIIYGALSAFESTSAKIELQLEAPDAVVKVDLVLMQQVMVNLIENAIKYGGGDITIGTVKQDGKLLLSVMDRGSGVADADKSAIFEKFNRRSASGIGLGLSICRSITEAHGAIIRVGDRVGGGAIFTVVLPLVDILGGEPVCSIS